MGICVCTQLYDNFRKFVFGLRYFS